MTSNTSDDSDSTKNVWESLHSPLCDLYLQVIVPQYLNVQDLLQLAAVSRRYGELFHCTRGCGKNNIPGKTMLVALLRRDAQYTHHIPGYKMYDQLPTIGNLSVKESLEQDPLAVAQLRTAALRRRRLLLLENNDAADESQIQLEPILTSFQPTERNIARYYQTKFVCMNLSGADVFCHWIDHDGQISVRDEGDCLPSAVDGKQPTSFAMTYSRSRNSHGCPPHILCHGTYTSHSFALCRHEGGTPFAIYQSRQIWRKLRHNTHVHAIAVLPGCKIQELYCSYFLQGWGGYPLMDPPELYALYDRASGVLIPSAGGPTISEETAPTKNAAAARELYNATDIDTPSPQQPLQQRGSDSDEFWC